MTNIFKRSIFILAAVAAIGLGGCGSRSATVAASGSADAAESFGDVENYITVFVKKDAGESGEKFCKAVNEACLQLDKRGYDVVSVESVIAGRYDIQKETTKDYSWGAGWGYSFTDGFVIIGKLR